jgi:hypothetical protein
MTPIQSVAHHAALNAIAHAHAATHTASRLLDPPAARPLKLALTHLEKAHSHAVHALIAARAPRGPHT